MQDMHLSLERSAISQDHLSESEITHESTFDIGSWCAVPSRPNRKHNARARPRIKIIRGRVIPDLTTTIGKLRAIGTASTTTIRLWGSGTAID
jgi:hypothetical protein